MITQGEWTVKNYCVVTNIPPERPHYSWEDKEFEYNCYGGYLVAEGIMNIDDSKLIASAPEMLHVLTYVTEANEEDPQLPFWVYWEMKRLIKKSTGECGSYKNPFKMVDQLKEQPQLCLPEAPKFAHHGYYSVENTTPWLRA